MAAAPERTLSPATVVLAGSIPLLFLHVYYQPDITVDAFGTELSAYGSDFAVVAVALAAFADGLRRGFAPLRAAPALWIAGGALVAAVLGSALWGSLVDGRYDTVDHVTSAAKFTLYALLAPAVALLVRTRRELGVVLAAVIAWSAALTVVGLLQYEGHADVFGFPNPHTRVPSWLGIADFGTYSAAVLGIALTALALAPLRPPFVVPAVLAGAAGGGGAVLAAPLGPLVGVALAGVLLVVVAWLRGLLTVLRFALGAALLLVVAVTAFAIRSPDIEHFQEFVQEDPAPAETRENVQTYAQRTILVYVGGRIFLDHPLVGVGWQGSTEPFHAVPYVDDARRRFPNQPEFSLPTEEHPWGVQNAYVQAAADMGVLGLLALVATILTGIVVAFVAARDRRTGDFAGAIALCWLLVTGVELAAYGLVAGVPIDALLWLGVGLAASAAASTGPPPTLRFRA